MIDKFIHKIIATTMLGKYISQYIYIYQNEKEEEDKVISK